MLGVPAHPEEKVVAQPDGTTVTLRQYGDEYLHFTATADGYTVVRNQEGFYVYAALEEGVLVPTAFKAHDEASRNAAERSFLSGVSKRLQPEMTKESASRKAFEKASRREAREKVSRGVHDYSKFQGLIVLVEYNDCPFSRDDYREVFEDMIRKKGYTGYMSAGNTEEWVDCTGSVFDYYYDNSMGIFEANFDIVGPIKLNRSMYYVNSSYNAPNLMVDVINAADSSVDFSKYDTDGDGKTDMMYFVFSGPGSHYTGNDSRLLWPHSADLSNFVTKYADGVKIGRYACSTELARTPDLGILEGIGTICHEFSHVLGLEDLYDTDGAGSGGASEMTPELWSVMDAGCYIDDSKTPAGYSLMERYLIGFAQPELLDKEGDYVLEAFDTSNRGLQLNTDREGEFFMIENRQKVKWNRINPGHGMIVYHVDYTNPMLWVNNAINCNPSHNNYILMRATGEKYDYTGTPFPGTGLRTMLGNSTTPSLKSWSGANSALVLNDIRENADGTISFTASTKEGSSGIDRPAAEESATPEYFDLTGRKLSVAPTDGSIYILRSGSRVEKKIGL